MPLYLGKYRYVQYGHVGARRLALSRVAVSAGEAVAECLGPPVVPRCLIQPDASMHRPFYTLAYLRLQRNVAHLPLTGSRSIADAVEATDFPRFLELSEIMSLNVSYVMALSIPQRHWLIRPIHYALCATAHIDDVSHRYL